jgi:hypothetical protein
VPTAAACCAHANIHTNAHVAKLDGFTAGSNFAKDVTQNASQESMSKRFAGMRWDNGCPTVGVSNEVMAVFDSNHSVIPGRARQQ